MDENENATLNPGADPPPEPSQGEESETSWNPSDFETDADPGEDAPQEADEQAAEADEVPEPRTRADKRIRSLVDERKAMEDAAEAAGLVWDKENRRFVPRAAEDEFAWEPEQEQPQTQGQPQGENAPDPGVEQYAEFWNVDPTVLEQMDAETAGRYTVSAEWFKRALSARRNPETMTSNDWAAFIENYGFQQTMRAQQQQAETAREAQAQKAVTEAVKAVATDPRLQHSKAAQDFVKSEVKRFRDQGVPASEVERYIPAIRARALEQHFDEIVQAAAKRAQKAEEARTVRFGAQSPQSADAPTKAAPDLTAEEREICDAAGISYARYAARKAAIQ